MVGGSNPLWRTKKHSGLSVFLFYKKEDYQLGIFIEIEKKQRDIEKIKIKTPKEVFSLQEVQEIKDAIQEHLIFIGLDKGNNIRTIRLLGIGTSSEINIDYKDIVRTALVNACDRVILVHNHPANNLEPSNQDRNLTNTINKLLYIFNIKLLDHIIVTENNYLSMLEIDAINEKYENNKMDLLKNTLLIEENKKQKTEIEKLKNKLQKYEAYFQQEEDEFE